MAIYFVCGAGAFACEIRQTGASAPRVFRAAQATVFPSPL